MIEKPSLAEQISDYAISHFELGIIHCAAGYIGNIGKIVNAGQNFRNELVSRMKEQSKLCFMEAGLERRLDVEYMTWEQITSGKLFNGMFESRNVRNLDNWMNSNVGQFSPNTIYVVQVDYAREKIDGENVRTAFYTNFVEHFEGGSGRMTQKSASYYEKNNIYFLFLFLSKEDFKWYMSHQSGRGISNFQKFSEN